MTCFANTTTKHDVYVLPLPDIFVLNCYSAIPSPVESYLLKLKGDFKARFQFFTKRVCYQIELEIISHAKT